MQQGKYEVFNDVDRNIQVQSAGSIEGERKRGKGICDS
jgi:hypothetical protein